MKILENGTAGLALTIAGRRFAHRVHVRRIHTRMTNSPLKMASDELTCTVERASRYLHASSRSGAPSRPKLKLEQRGRLTKTPPDVMKLARSSSSPRRDKASRLAASRRPHKVVAANKKQESVPKGAPSTDGSEDRKPDREGVVGKAVSGNHAAKVPSVSAASLKRNSELRSKVLKTLISSPIEHPVPAVGTSSRKRSLSERLSQAYSDFTKQGSGFKAEEWSSGWGQDELAPPVQPVVHEKENASPLETERTPPPHKYGSPPVRRAGGQLNGGVEGECTSILQDIQSPSEHKPIARLAHGLDRVLFNPGVHWLQDPRSRVYNFNPWLESIPRVTDFAFERISGFVKSSMDNDMHMLAKKHKRRFTGSTSSLTGLLSHVYFLISGDREVDTSPLSSWFVHEPTTFTPGQRMPTSVVLNHRAGVFSIDAGKADEWAEKNVLTWMGTMLERFLTVTEPEFRMLLRSRPDSEEDHDTRREAYRYAMSDRFIMRSQLDCVDPRLPGTGVFDIKTRAAVPIRLDVLNYEENSGYLIKSLTGPLESFEKEYYDLIRSAFLKYSFQARIGNMDGVLVAYHNTARIFGFQYIPLTEMEARLYGSGNGTRLFNKCIQLLETVLDEIVSVYSERSVKCTFETREKWNELNVWIEPAEWDQAAEGKPCPITQLNVEVATLVRDSPVRKALIVATNEPWTLNWTILQSTQPEDHIRANLEGAQRRQFRALSFPADVSTVQEMEARWQGLDFGGKRLQQVAGPSASNTPPFPTILTSPSTPDDDGEIEGAADTEETAPDDQVGTPPSQFFRSMVFRRPDRNIQRLRGLAREGRDETLRLQAELEGREKVVWGVESGSVGGGNVSGSTRKVEEYSGAPEGSSDESPSSSSTTDASPDSTRQPPSNPDASS